MLFFELSNRLSPEHVTAHTPIIKCPYF